MHPSNAFVLIYGGTVTGFLVDLEDAETDEFVSAAIRSGAKVERVTIYHARKIRLYEPWVPQPEEVKYMEWLPIETLGQFLEANALASALIEVAEFRGEAILWTRWIAARDCDWMRPVFDPLARSAGSATHWRKVELQATNPMSARGPRPASF